MSKITLIILFLEPVRVFGLSSGIDARGDLWM